MPPRLVLLDRDGVINVDSADYILAPDDWVPLPGSVPAIARLNRAAIAVAVCTNQSAVGRGMLTPATLAAIHSRMDAVLANDGAHIDRLFYCPHAPDAGCHCRKPAPGLVEQALAAFAVRPDEALFIGDSGRDLEAARQAGVTPWLVRTGNGAATEATLPAPVSVYDNLAAAVAALLDT